MRKGQNLPWAPGDQAWGKQSPRGKVQMGICEVWSRHPPEVEDVGGLLPCPEGTLCCTGASAGWGGVGRCWGNKTTCCADKVSSRGQTLA